MTVMLQVKYMWWSFTRSEQHHRHHRVHLEQHWRPQRQERRGQEEPVQLRLVFLLWRVVIHRGWSHRRARCQHLHWEKQGSARQTAQLPENRSVVVFAIHANPELSAAQTALSLQLAFHRAISRQLACRAEDGGVRATSRWDLHVHSR